MCLCNPLYLHVTYQTNKVHNFSEKVNSVKIKSQQTYKGIMQLDSHLKSRIFGQDHVVEHVIDMLSISIAGLNDDTKPIASFLFTGPTGVGKTELAKELALCLGINFIRFDMSEYADEYSARNLTGGQAGLEGYKEGGLLTNAIMKNPKCVLLLDEIEKADKLVLNTFLQVLDYGTLTDTKGNKADFTETIIIMTSNLGANEQNGIGFGNDKLYKGTAIVDFLTPEFRNRIDKTLEFNKLTKEMVVYITEKFLTDLSKQLSKKNFTLSITDEAKKVLNEIGFDPLMGARSVLRAINSEFKKEISRILLSSNASAGTISIDHVAEEFTYLLSVPDASKTKSLFDMGEKDYDFETAEEAQEYARKHIGVVVTRSHKNRGYIKLRNYLNDSDKDIDLGT